MKRTPLENLSITVKIVVKPWDSGKSVMKSTAICDHGLLGMGKGMSLPAGNI